MRFGARPLADCAGTILAHSHAVKGRKLPKGHILGPADLEDLREAGVKNLTVAVPDPGDVLEDAAAGRLAKALAGANTVAEAPATGRANLVAKADGVARIDPGLVQALNAIDEGLTLATLRPFARVAAGRMIATVKIIPFALPEGVVDHAERLSAESAGRINVAPFRSKRAGLVLTRLPHVKDSLLDKTRQVMAQRLDSLGGSLATTMTATHDEAAVAEALEGLGEQELDLYLLFGASAIVDRRDVLPAALMRAGGDVRHLGMPVDPGNLLMLGELGGKPVLGLPGCARSAQVNGVDWVLERLAADLPVSDADFAEMGVGGLLKETPARPKPRRRRAASKQDFSAAAVVLAAGRGRRMAAPNKMLAPVNGAPMLRRVVETALESRASPVLVVVGYEADAVKAAISDLPVTLVENSAYASGMASSLRTGLAQLPEEADAVAVLLGDMPCVRADTLDALIDALARTPDAGAIAPMHEGKRGNPVIWHRRTIGRLMTSLKSDRGGKHLLEQLGDERLELAVDDPGVLIDVDTEEALASLDGNR